MEVTVAVVKQRSDTIKRNTIPSTEGWLYKNKEALKNVQKFLKEAAKATKLNLDELWRSVLI